MNGVRVDGLTKRYATTLALDDVSLEVQPGEFFGLLGPSGSGKTTLLRLIAGFETADAGRIAIGERRVERVPVEHRAIGMVFQSYALFPNLSVAGNVGFGLSVRGVPRAEIRHRVARALALVRLDTYGKRNPRELSGGQRQRVALARAIVIDPVLLLLDEPLGALDKSLRQDMQLELRRIQRETGLTTLFVTHDQEEALAMSDRVGILRDGQLIQHGRPTELYDRPSSAFVATFLGDANLFPGRVESNGIRLADGARLAVDTAGWPVGCDAILAVRPERMQLDSPASRTDGTAQLANRLDAIVESMTFTGATVLYRLRRADGNDALLASEPNDGRARHRVGETLTMHWHATAGTVLAASEGASRKRSQGA